MGETEKGTSIFPVSGKVLNGGGQVMLFDIMSQAIVDPGQDIRQVDR